MVIHKTIKDFFKRKRTIRNKNLIIKIGKDVYRIKEPTELEMNEYYLAPHISRCEYFCDLAKECFKFSDDECKLCQKFFLQKLSDIETLMLSNKK